MRKFGVLLLVILGLYIILKTCEGYRATILDDEKSKEQLNTQTRAYSKKEEEWENRKALPTSLEADLPGQVKRIMAEGMDDAKIQKNIADVDKSVTYEHLKKNAERYAGKPWSLTGKILEISESGGGTTARIALDDWGNKVIYVAGPFTTDFIEKNRVYVVGYLAGNHSYTSQANWDITIPALAARAMLKPQDVAKFKLEPKASPSSITTNLATNRPVPSPTPLQTPMFQR